MTICNNGNGIWIIFISYPIITVIPFSIGTAHIVAIVHIYNRMQGIVSVLG